MMIKGGFGMDIPVAVISVAALFDDSFSALDVKTDARLRAALKQEVTESAVIIVAQRISTIIDVDQIVVLDEGRIVGKGTHKELQKTVLFIGK